MTPLAAFLAKQLIVRQKHRTGIWVSATNRNHLRSHLEETHFFECTKALPLIAELAQKFGGLDNNTKVETTESMFEKFAFLPAPKTWLEWRVFTGEKVAVLLEELERPPSQLLTISPKWAHATVFCELMAENLGYLSLVSGDYFDGHPGNITERRFPNFLGPAPAVTSLSTAHILLLLVNTPKIICRRQIMPNRSLERELTRGLGAGKFPLRAWTEIQLSVAKPVEIDDGEPHEAHLTGRRALHFCRKHIRIRLGRLEYVTSHWRGDPALGIKQSRYAVQP